MLRREAYGTSGPRIVLRLFGGWDYPDDLCQHTSFVEEGYASGVPMGADLPPRPRDADPSPVLAVAALQDPGTPDAPGTPLQRIQIIKAWVADGAPQERVIDVAGSQDNGASVDPTTCETHGRDSASLCAVWRDPDFDPTSPLGYHFVETHAAVFKNREQLFATLIHYSLESQCLNKNLLFFIDEVHGLKLKLQEGLYSVMKEWWLPTERGKYYILPFTIVAATTRFDLLDENSFITRFSNVWEINCYNQEDIINIIAYEFDKYGLTYSYTVLVDIAKRCLGIPRIAVTLSNKVRNTTLSCNKKEVTLYHTKKTFDLEEIDELGLQPVHFRYLRILASSQMNGKLMPIGIGSISSKMRYPEDMIKGSVEPVLLELNLVIPTPRGRSLTEAGVRYLAKKTKKRG